MGGKIKNLGCGGYREGKAAVALHFAHYDFCRVHSSLRVSPAMEAHLTAHVGNLTNNFPSLRLVGLPVLVQHPSVMSHPTCADSEVKCMIIIKLTG